MTSQNCSEVFNDFIKTIGKNTLLCENTGLHDFTCYNSKTHALCEYNMENSTNYSQYWEKMKIDKNKFYIKHNPVGINKCIININKKY